MNLILFGAGFIIFGGMLFISGIVSEIGMCVKTKPNETSVVFRKDTFQWYDAGFHELTDFKTPDGKKFYAWGLVKKDGEE